MSDFNVYGIKVPEILLPAEKKLDSWSVIACDQYTQSMSYWENAAKAAGDNPSTLNLILPEVYLSSADKSERIAKIKNTMRSYITGSVFDEPRNCFVYVERQTAYGRTRHGLVAAIDLETYEWKPFSKSLIRATEATIVERIPPRKEIRKGAPLESPHIMLLVNDSEKILVEACGKTVKAKTPLYDGDLMLDSGHITGWALESEQELAQVESALKILKEKNTSGDGSAFLFAVGDGNHSLATAKAVWDEYKAELIKNGADENALAENPVRYALVEIVNIYDTGLTFEPIHRVLFNAEFNSQAAKLIDYVAKKLNGTVKDFDTAQELEQAVKNSKAYFGFVYTCCDASAGEPKVFYKCLCTDIKELAVSRLQPVLDEYISSNSGTEIDYIHGSDEVFRLGKESNAVAILLPPIAKDSFFETINGRGPLPRKSFSMGEASEKRFYLECRRLFS